MHSISVKTPTKQRKPIEENRRKRKEWKVKTERAAQVNNEALTLLLEPACPTPSNKLSTKSFHWDTERGTIWDRKIQIYEIMRLKIQIRARQISGAHSWSAKNAQLCHRIRKQQHPRPAQSSEGSRNLPKLWSPRLGKPLQISKYKCLAIDAVKLCSVEVLTNTYNCNGFTMRKVLPKCTTC